MTKHVHAELMMEYAKDWAETDKPWARWESDEGHGWESFSMHPRWSRETKYRRKPRTIDINGIEVPEPYRGEMPVGAEYYSPFLPDTSLKYTWSKAGFHEDMQRLGLVHLSEDAATTHAEALASLTKMDSK